MTTIITKNGSGAPTAGQLTTGELAVDLTNKELYTKDSGGNVIKVGAQGGSTGTFTDLTATSSFTSPGIDDNANATAITIDASENVGVGTPSPSTSLDIVRAGVEPLRVASTTSNTVQVRLANTAGNAFINGVGNDIVIPSGNVGIGTDSPFFTASGRASLSVNGTSSSILAFGKGGSSENYILADAGGFTVGNTSATLPTAFFNNGSTTMTIAASGNVGIGNTNPTSKLTIGDGTADAAIQFPCATKNNFIGYDGSFDGLQLATNGEIKFQAGTSYTERMRLDANGNLGIGTSNPTRKLWVEQTDGVNNINGVFKTNSPVDSVIAFSDGNSTNGDFGVRCGSNGDNFSIFTNGANERLTVDASGNVGIGTDAPGQKLTVSDTTASNTSTYVSVVSGDTGNAGITFGDNAANLNGGILYNNADDALRFFKSGFTEAMRIDSAGNLGIGTDSPNISGGGAASTSLTVSASASNGNGLLELKGTRAAGSVVSYVRSFNNNGATPITDILSYSGATSPDTTGELAFHTSNAEAMRIDANGDVGIGTSNTTVTAAAKNLVVGTTSGNNGLTIMSSPTSAGSIHFGDTFTTGSGSYQGVINYDHANSTMNFYTQATKRMTLDASGNLLVGTTAAIASTQTSVKAATNRNCLGLQNTNNNNYLITAYDTTAEVFRVAGNGNVLNTNNSYGALSDERLKSDIVDASSQLDDIMAVKVRNYTLDSTGDTHIGVVAQELEASGMGSLVDEDKEGMKSVKYSVLYLKAVKALQEAVTRIETLEAEVAALKGA